MEKVVVAIEHLEKSFGANSVLKDINVELENGENLVVFGKSGSGKSVLIKCLVGLIVPDAGKVAILGADISKLSTKELNELRKKIGFLFQSGALYDSMTVRENLIFPLRGNKQLKEEDKNALAEDVLENVGLKEAIDKMPSELSGGMRKRVGLARTLILKPEIILYDEPTTGLDPITSKEISQLILDVQKKYKASSIIITHDVACAEITSNKMLILRDGLVYVSGTYEELEASKDEWVGSFFK